MKCVDCIKRAADELKGWHKLKNYSLSTSILVRDAVAISKGDSVCMEHLIARNT